MHWLHHMFDIIMKIPHTNTPLTLAHSSVRFYPFSVCKNYIFKFYFRISFSCAFPRNGSQYTLQSYNLSHCVCQSFCSALAQANAVRRSVVVVVAASYIYPIQILFTHTVRLRRFENGWRFQKTVQSHFVRKYTRMKCPYDVVYGEKVTLIIRLYSFVVASNKKNTSISKGFIVCTYFNYYDRMRSHQVKFVSCYNSWQIIIESTQCTNALCHC